MTSGIYIHISEIFTLSTTIAKGKKGISRWLDAVWYRWYARTCRTAKTNAAKRRRYRSSTIEKFSTLSLSLSFSLSLSTTASGGVTTTSGRLSQRYHAAATGRLIGLWIQRVRTDVRRLQVISAQTLPATSSLTVDHWQSDRGKRSFQRNSRKIATDRIL